MVCSWGGLVSKQLGSEGFSPQDEEGGHSCFKLAFISFKPPAMLIIFVFRAEFIHLLPKLFLS